VAGEVGQVDTPIALPVAVAGVAGDRAEFANTVLGDAMDANPLATDEVSHCLIAALTEAFIVVCIAGVVGMSGQQQAQLGMIAHLPGYAQQQRAVSRSDGGAVEVELHITLPAPADACGGCVRVLLCEHVCGQQSACQQRCGQEDEVAHDRMVVGGLGFIMHWQTAPMAGRWTDDSRVARRYRPPLV